MLSIKKRNGNVEEFNITKIQNAIEKAFIAEHKFYNKDMEEIVIWDNQPKPNKTNN